jgi:hypothetical protein
MFTLKTIIETKTKEESVEAQRLCFKLGFNWAGVASGSIVQNYWHCKDSYIVLIKADNRIYHGVNYKKMYAYSSKESFVVYTFDEFKYLVNTGKLPATRPKNKARCFWW